MPQTTLSEAAPSAVGAHRDPTFDNLKGLLIALVVAGHVLEKIPAGHGWAWPEGSAWKPVYCLIYLVHMPAFSFVSGYLSSSRKTLFAHARELLSLYVLGQLLWCGFLFVLSLVGGTRPGYQEVFLILPGIGLWYLLCLFIWRACTPLLAACKFPRVALLGLAGAGAAIGLVVSVGETFSLSRLIAFAPFFAAGFWCRQEKWRLTSPRLGWGDAVLLAAGSGAGAWVLREAMDRTTDLLTLAHSFEYGGFLRRGVLFRLAYYLAALAAIRAFFLLVPKREGWLTQLGLASLSIYIGHFYVLETLRVFLPASFWTSHMFWLAPVLVISCCCAFSFGRLGDRLARSAARGFDRLFGSPVAS